jgi:hypothetical protein
VEVGFPACAGTQTHFCGAYFMDEYCAYPGCGKPTKYYADQYCSSCLLAHYCDKECQTSDWKRHKPECRAAVASSKAGAIVPCALALKHLHPHPLTRFLFTSGNIPPAYNGYYVAASRLGQTQEAFYDVCRGEVAPGSGAWHCAQCEFDVCIKCADAPHSSDASRLRTELNDALIAAASDNDTEALRSLLARGADANTTARDYSMFHPMHFAAQHDNAEAVCLLAAHGASLDRAVKDLGMMTISGPFGFGMGGDEILSFMHLAAAAGAANATRELARLGAPLEALSTAGRTPLLLAAIGGPHQLYLPTLSALVDAGARLDARGRDGLNALDLVVANWRSAERGARPDYEETIDFLRARGLECLSV